MVLLSKLSDNKYSAQRTTIFVPVNVVVGYKKKITHCVDEKFMWQKNNSFGEEDMEKNVNNANKKWAKK